MNIFFLTHSSRFRPRPWIVAARVAMILGGIGLVAVSVALADGAASNHGPSREQLLRSLGEPARFSVGLGNPEDPRTWKDQPYDPDLWQPLSRLTPTDCQDVVSVTFWGTVTDEDKYAATQLPIAYHVNDRQIELLSKVKTLRRLGFAEAGLTAQHFKTLSSLPNVQVVHLQDTGTTNDSLESVGRMRELRSLAIYDEPIDGVGLKHLESLSKLVSFSLCGTKVDDAGLAGLSHLKSLKFVRLGPNTGRLTDAGLVHLASLDALEILQLDGDSSSRIHGTGLKHVPANKLRVVKLPVAMSDDGLAAVAMFSNLRQLDISGSPVTDKGIQALKPLRNLEWLQAGSTKITGEGLENLTGLVKLELAKSAIRSENLKSMTGLKRLQRLVLAGTPLAGDCLRPLSNMERLEDLDVSCTKISNESLQHLETLRRFTT